MTTGGSLKAKSLCFLLMTRKTFCTLMKPMKYWDSPPKLEVGTEWVFKGQTCTMAVGSATVIGHL